MVAGILAAANLASGLLWLIPAALLAVAIFFFVKMSQASDFDLDDRKLETVVKLLRMLNADTPQESEVTVDIDFRSYKKGGEKLKDEKPAPWQQQLAYEHSWLGLRGVLMDGNRYDLRVTDLAAVKKKTKRKYTKVKERIRSRLDIALRLKSADPAQVAAHLEQSARPASLVLRSARHRGRRLTCSLMTPEYTWFKGRGDAVRDAVRETGPEHRVSGDHILKALLWIYDGVGRVRGKAA